MARPFPGMDPWLEHPAIWPGVHQRLITYISDAIQPRLGPRYYVDIGERVYLELADRSVYPDLVMVETHPRGRVGPAVGTLQADAPVRVHVAEQVELREPFLEVRETHRGERVVAVIEVLSPANKRPGAGREVYQRKQADVLASDAHLVEVDLLRGGEPSVALPPGAGPASAYRVVVSRGSDRSAREVYPFGVQDRLPRVGLPLLPPDPDAVLDLPAVLEQVWERGAYAQRLSYEQEPLPPLGASEAAWARERLASWRAASSR